MSTYYFSDTMPEAGDIRVNQKDQVSALIPFRLERETIN